MNNSMSSPALPQGIALLQYAIEKGMIDIAYVQEKMEMETRKNLLAEHRHKIWHGKDGYWYTYIGKEHRKMIKKKSRKDLEDTIINYIKSYGTTVEDVFYSWIEQKYYYGDIQKQTYDRYKTDFTRFFDGSKLKTTSIMNITEKDLEQFIRKTIKEKNLTRKAFSNLRLIINGIFKYAKKCGYTQISITQFYGDLELPKKCFKKVSRIDKLSVFTDEEVSKIKTYILDNESIINYGILLAFETGLRVGELSALQYSDINDNMLSVSKTEIRYRDTNGNYIFEVRESPKTEAGNRNVILTSNAQATLKKIRKLNPFGEYIFMKDGKRIKGKAFTAKLQKICSYVGIEGRSIHKARKTYATNLLNKGVDESIIIDQMGHTDISCTRHYYYYNNKDIAEAREQIENAITC